MKHKDTEDMIKKLTSFYDWICKRMIPGRSSDSPQTQPEKLDYMLDLTAAGFNEQQKWRDLLLDIGIDIFDERRTVTVYDGAIMLTEKEFEAIKDRLNRLEILFRKHDLKDFPIDLIWNRKFEWFYEGKA